MSGYSVLVTRRLPEAGMALIREAAEVRLWEEDRPLPPDKLREMVRGVHGIVCLLTDPLTREVIAAAGSNLRVISTMAVGYDNIDLEAATRRGVLVANTPGVLTEATADLTWALLLSLSRRIVEGDRLVREGKFAGWSPTLLVGGDFHGKILGIVGLGRIGKAVARRAMGFGMDVLFHNRRKVPEEELAGLRARQVPLPELLRLSDYVSLHCPLNPESHHLIDRQALERMKPSAYLVNVARGPVVDEAAVVQALREGKIAGAALDVYEHEPELSAGLAELPNVILAPHLGSASQETRDKMSVMAAQNLITGLAGEIPPFCLNPDAVKNR